MKPSRVPSVRREKYALKTANKFSVTFDTNAVTDFVDALREDVAAALRPAAQKGAQLLYEQVKANVAAIGGETGNLQSSIYQVFSEYKSTPNVSAEYHISWNGAKAPHGHLVEYGYIQRYQRVISRKTGKWITLKNKRLATPKQIPPRAFIRRATAQFPAALQATETEFMARLKVFK
jgi:hypothetical protein